MMMAATGFAQSKFSIGLTGGARHAFVSSYDNNTFNPCWNAGLTFNYSPWEHWAIGMDAIYSNEGYKIKIPERNNMTTYSTLDYVRITPKAIYFFRPYEANFRPKFSIGPSVGFLVNQDNPNGEVARNTDLGAQGSIGFNLRLVKELWLNVDAAYYQGLLDVYKKPTGGNDYNANMGLNLGLTFGF